jgi:hypothetical protein
MASFHRLLRAVAELKSIRPISNKIKAATTPNLGIIQKILMELLVLNKLTDLNLIKILIASKVQQFKPVL